MWENHTSGTRVHVLDFDEYSSRIGATFIKDLVNAELRNKTKHRKQRVDSVEI